MFRSASIIIALVAAGVPAVLAGPRSDPSDSSMSVERLVAEVTAANPGLRAARARERSAFARVAQAGAWDDPQAGVEFYATPTSSLNPVADGMETDYFLQQMVPFPGKKGTMEEAAKAGAAMATQSTRLAERRLVAETKRAAAMLYAAQRRLDVNGANQALLDQIVSSARAKYGVGVGSQADVLKLQVESSRLDNERSVIDQEVVSAVAMINALRGLPGTTPIGTLRDPLLGDIAWGADSLVRSAFRARPELAGMREEIRMNRAELSAAAKEWWPDVMLKGTYKQMRDQHDQWAAMIGINIPIAPWGIGKYAGRTEENAARVAGSETALMEMENMVQSEVRDAHAKVRARWVQLDRYRATILPRSEQALESTLAAYRSDRVDFLSLLDSYRTLEMFRMEFYMTVGEYLASRAALERAVGEDLP